MPKLSDSPLGIYEKALPPGSWPELLSSARELGFDFLEMSIDESDERLARLDWTHRERLAFRSALDDTGMRVPSICLSGNRRYPLGSENPSVRAKAVELVCKAVDLSVDLGVRLVQLAGYDEYYEARNENTKRLFGESLAEAVEYAARRCVMLSMEVMDTPFMSSISRFLVYRERIPSPWLTVYPDLGNLSAWNDNAAEELELGLRLGIVAAVHLKDTLPATGDSPGQFRDVPFGTGCVDFPGLFTVLKTQGYTGHFLVEMWNRRGQADLQGVREAREWFVQLLRTADAEEE